ncbi:YjfK family protein [Halomonas sp. V046]|uniref:YjfK family protein n=1 Tax=Halomonas sp. V046 TaxID=3459611 RepID=UPI004044A729
MLKRLFGRRKEPENHPGASAPEILGLHLGGTFTLDTLKLRLLDPLLVTEGIAATQIIQAVGEIRLDDSSSILRFYTDDDAFLQVFIDGGRAETDITDVKLWHFYQTLGIASDTEWDHTLRNQISQPHLTLEGHRFHRTWESTGQKSPPLAMTEKTYSGDGNITETDQFGMLYERDLGESRSEYLFYIAEERLVDGNLDRCVVTSTGIDISPADIQFT